MIASPSCLALIQKNNRDKAVDTSSTFRFLPCFLSIRRSYRTRMDHHKLITRVFLLLNPCDAQLVSDFHEVNAFVVGFFIEEARKSIWRYKSATPKSPATNRKWVSSSDGRLALDIQLSDTCWPDKGGLQPAGDRFINRFGSATAKVLRCTEGAFAARRRHMAKTSRFWGFTI